MEGRLGDPSFLVLDCTTHLIPDPKITYTVKSGREDFEKGHIPGAQFVDIQADVSDEYHQAALHAAAAGGIRRRDAPLGVSDDSQVVALQHRQPAMGDAGVVGACGSSGLTMRRCWTAAGRNGRSEGRALETGPGAGRSRKPSRRRAQAADGRQGRRAGGDRRRRGLHPERAEAPQHAGTGGNTYGRPGRIAGSANVPAARLIDPATNAFLPPASAGAQVRRGGAFDREVITYCGGGIAASATAFALVMLGHPDVSCTTPR